MIGSLLVISPLSKRVGWWFGLKVFFVDDVLETCMFTSNGNSGKLIVYASSGSQSRTRFESVQQAAKETAKRLNLDFEIIRFKRSALPIYVYYEENINGEPIPIYCDEGKISGLEEICNAMRNMMFVLSFHPKHPSLAQMRNELTKLS
jgi:hypothetical protein